MQCCSVANKLQNCSFISRMWSESVSLCPVDQSKYWTDIRVIELQVFDFEPLQERERLTAVERRLFRSPGSAASKWRTQDRNSARAANAAYKGAMMAGFEE